jgi:hypothetical protein
MKGVMAAHDHAVSSALEAALSGVRDPYARGVITNHLLKALQPKARRKPPEAGLPVPAVPPRGPRPKLGGAEAPLDLSN